jgi:hypothetical protein
MYKRFKVIKDVGTQGLDQQIKKGTEITVIDDKIYCNGGMVDSMFYDIFFDLVKQELSNGYHFLKEETIPYNKV